MLLPRAATESVGAAEDPKHRCTALGSGDLIIPRTTFIVAITLCIFITAASLLGLAVLAYREYARRRQAEEAKAWGRKSRYLHRMSFARKQVDLSFSSQYRGCLFNQPENPEMGLEGPFELGEQERLCEVPAMPARAAVVEARKDARRSKFLSLFFDHGLGVWVPRGGN